MGRGGYAGIRVCVVWEERMMLGRLERKGVSVEASANGSSDRILGTGKGVMADYGHATSTVRNSWTSSCPSQLSSSFFIMWSRAPGSFWVLVKAASSMFMKVRNSGLERVQLSLSFLVHVWKTAET